MYVVEVIPISRSIRTETLSYFTGKEIPLGAIVTVPLRSARVPAFVVSVAPATEAKTDIKKKTYSLKKLADIHAVRFFLPAFVSAAEKYARYSATGTGAVIGVFLAQKLLSKTPPQGYDGGIVKKNRRTAEKLLLQADDEERFAAYKGIIRESFAKKESVLLLVPSAHDAERMRDIFEKGVREYIHVFHQDMGREAMVQAWNSIVSAAHPVLTIGTATSLSLPRGDWGTVIVDREESSAYKLKRRPFSDARTFAEFFSDGIGARFILGASMLRIETLYKKERGEYQEFAPLRFRALSPAEELFIDMRKDKDGFPAHAGKFYTISEELKSAVRNVIEDNAHMLILTARRGLAPLTVCNDCGDIVLCAHCSAPVVLHKGRVGAGQTGLPAQTRNVFLCHKCGTRRTAEDQCEKCNGWRLSPLGIGAQKGEEDLRVLFPEGVFFRLDKDTAPTKKKAERIIEDFYAHPGSILIGTEMALAYLHKKIAATAVLSIDSLFMLPDFRINEKIFSLLMKLRSRAIKTFIIQTRAADNPLFGHVLRGNMLEFYREEIQAREMFHYPPFTTLIKLTWNGTESQIIKIKQEIESLFEAYDIAAFPAFTTKIRGKFVMHALLRVPRETWPNTEITDRLRSLPPSIAVSVDPEHLL